MKNYDYPRVNPPSLQPPQPSSDRRYSWMETPADVENRTWTNPTREEQGTSSPPQVSEHQVQNTERGNAASAHPYQMQDPRVVQQMYVEEPRYQTAYSTQQAASQLPSSVPPSTQIQEQPSTAPQPPDPVKQAPDQVKKLTAPIEPDVNPLTPTTPKVAQRASTNMAIVPPPSDPAQFSVGIYTPSPQSIRGGSWQHGLCSCAEPSTCLTGLFCPCIVYGRTQYRLGLRGERKDPTNMLGYTAVNGSCIAFAILCGINGVLSAIQHTRIRKTYNMNSEAGNVPGDCVKGFCCCCCVVAKDEKEVRYREEQARKPGASTNQEGYVAPTGMNFSPPPR
ncbi:PLAC8 family-domain-containing protein [Exophiala viscosa]|uniref:PLAC8 family-domain-containing protein n=1 Tax=Exophiala viscosa TaxID=2486360 RepID=A0AAN6IAY7_9EURO|nr:PLAC8 family-domain-containing protein [Exophiala viscosa]